jgi:hypothetical protein
MHSNTYDRSQLAHTSCAISNAHWPSTERCAAALHQSMLRPRSCQRTRSQKQLQRAMTTTTAIIQLAAAAHGVGKHCRAAQSPIHHCIQPCASSASATPAMLSTMLTTWNLQFVTSLIEAQMEMSRAADGQPDLGSGPDLRQCTRPSVLSNARPSDERALHTRSRKLFPAFPYAAEGPPL